ncbi:hypothetical protein [Lentilactobacillus hilgardii]|uniref:Uncharacterized protein n=1 Tax=Lentilactobacillus hilgardii TaxID=1588 RepID=A0A6P1E5B2_LENHI|nr:hypothetical protein [Lentilactobacillus hilgardii]MCT3392511.1 hypothetical protein [Lentilactobacillus hilgardii]QHB50972.1 hypothetical protein GQR93_01395 [Lentilactobacillus hilgardii]RRG11858.1 MAG: hypothetical protein DUD35_05015 [Lactobacillus sp.]
MTATIVLDRFNIYNDRDLTLNKVTETSRMVEDPPFFQIRFYVSSPYFSEDMNGNNQLARKYRRLFNKLKADFAKVNAPIFDSPDNYPTGFESLAQVDQVVKDLQKAIQSKIVIPGKIELNTIELLGNWEVYSGNEETELAQELNRQTNAEVAQWFKDNHIDPNV